MYRPRIIPVLLLRNRGLVKSIKFKDHRYIGDPINAVRIFNEMKADELVFMDITASQENRIASLEVLKHVGEEANMPFSVGGGIRTLEQIRSILEVGAEKVILNTMAVENPNFIKSAAELFGSSTISACIDVKKNFFGKNEVRYYSGSKKCKKNPIEWAKELEQQGVGEIIVQSIDSDGTMQGYDIGLISDVANSVSIPVVALGGAGKMEHIRELYSQVSVNGFAAGSLFVYHGQRNAVLINYPTKEEINSIFEV